MLFFCLFVCFFVFFVCLFLFVCLFVCLFACLLACLLVCLFVCLFYVPVSRLGYVGRCFYFIARLPNIENAAISSLFFVHSLYSRLSNHS